jgi:protein-disulfide isomerase
VKALLALVMIFGLVACSPSASQLKKTIENNPDILTNVIEKHPDKIMEALQTAARTAQQASREKETKEEESRREDEFKNPKIAEIPENRATRGPKDAPVTLIEYSDFQCPFCARGYQTVEAIESKYKGKVRFMYKHLPLDFHPLAMPAAKRFEAIALQDGSKAYKFHDKVFSAQEKLKDNGEKWLDTVAKDVGADVAKMKKDMEGEEVKKRIEADMAEARKFGFSGTPGFLVQGVSLRGAYPPEEFEKIIDRVLGEKK